MALSDILKKYGDGPAVEGIMMPTVSTTQEIYNAATDGIMTVQGNQYTGPNAVVQYGNEQQGFPRQLKEIEGPMLPQFDQTTLPKVGKGIMESSAGTSTPEPVVKTPVEQFTIDPCPSGYKLVNGVCQLIQTRDDNKGNLKGKTVTNGIIEGYTRAALTPNPFSTGALNSNEMMALEEKYGAGVAKQIGLVDQQFNRGTQVKHVKEKINNPETGELVEVDAKNPDGTIKVENVIAISPTAEQALKEISPFTDLIDAISSGKIVEDAKKAVDNASSTIVNLITDNKKTEVTEDPTKVVQETKIDFGELSKNFGELQSSLLDTTNQLASIQENMLNMMKGRGTDTVELAKLQKQEKKLKVKKDNEMRKAKTLFEQSVEASKDQPLTDNEKKYIDSSNRKALPGESKDNKGNVDNRSGKVPGRENSGFGFKATSANYNKKTNTFDQRFK